MNSALLTRCPWPKTDLDIAYHDREWGVPVHHDRLLFEHLFLDTMQASLSWSLRLRRRENFRAAFDGFDAQKIACYNQRKVARLLADPGTVRNRLKIRAAITSSQAFFAVQATDANRNVPQAGGRRPVSGQQNRGHPSASCARRRSRDGASQGAAETHVRSAGANGEKEDPRLSGP